MTTHRCSACQQTKPVEHFYCRHDRDDKPDSMCKPCRKLQHKAYMKTQNGKKLQSKYNRQWIASGKAKAYSQLPQELARCKAKSARYRQRNPEKTAARNAIRVAKKRGDIKPARELACSECGQPAHDFHHFRGYAPEHHLDVIPLCKPCHHSAEKTSLISTDE